MGLPARNTPFPFPGAGPILDQMGIWAAWWAGDTGALRDAYQSRTYDTTAGPSRTSILGLLRRMWWGRVPGPGTTGRDRDAQLHIPVAADIAQGSADLLYSDPPALTLPDGQMWAATAGRLALYVEDGLHDVLSAGAEVGAALGGRYHRVTWDGRVYADRPFITTVHADAAWPEFAWGRLTAVTFWTHVGESPGGLHYRHVERHELDDRGNGIVLHGLYLGPDDSLGEPVDLTRHPATERLAESVNEDGVLEAPLTPGLFVEYFPNRTPQRLWRRHPVGASLGRSDLDGVEPLMDSLDETAASWMRDIRLGKARIVAAETALEATTPGNPFSLDLDREVYTTVNAFTRGDAARLPIEAVQFALRVEEHERTALFWANRVVQHAGYSTRQFSDPAPGDTNKTAAEVHAEQGLSSRTRARKVRLEGPHLARLLEKMLAVDVALGRAPLVIPARPVVEFADTVEDAPLALAQTLVALRGARAASTETLVRRLHPDWTDGEVGAEVAAIMAEDSADMADPALLRPRPIGPDVDGTADEVDVEAEGPDEG